MFGRRREQRALPPGAQLVATAPGRLIGKFSAEAHGIDQSLQHSAVWACVRLLADTVSTLPIDVYRDGTQVEAPRLLREPAAGQPVQEWTYSVMVSLLLRGNAYGLITARSGPGLFPAQVELVHPDHVGVSTEPDTGRVVYRIGGREYGRDAVWHVRAFTMPGVLLGLSPITYARQTIGLGLAAQDYGASYFASGGVPVGVLKVDGGLPPGDDRGSPEDHLLDDWERLPRRRAGVLLNMGFEAISVNPEESQFIETQRYNVAAIARLFGVAPEMIGAEAGNSLTYSNTEARALDYVRYSLAPWIVRLETALGRLLPTGLTVKFNLDALLRGTTKERYEAHAIGLASGFLTIDEVRALEDLPPLAPEVRPRLVTLGGTA
jgi:HK97 family phage portal protein